MYTQKIKTTQNSGKIVILSGIPVIFFFLENLVLPEETINVEFERDRHLSLSPSLAIFSGR